MEQHIVTMLTGAKATARLGGAHFLTAWLRVVPPGPQRPELQAPGAQLGGILSNTNPAYPSAPSPDPYGEVAQMVKYVKSESMAFLRVAATNGVQVTGEVPSPEADGFGADSAATLSAAVHRYVSSSRFFVTFFSLEFACVCGWRHCVRRRRGHSARGITRGNARIQYLEHRMVLRRVQLLHQSRESTGFLSASIGWREVSRLAHF